MIHVTQICASVTPWYTMGSAMGQSAGGTKTPRKLPFGHINQGCACGTVWIAHEKSITTTEKATQYIASIDVQLMVFQKLSLHEYRRITKEVVCYLKLYFKNIKILLWIYVTFRMVAIV